MSSISDILIWCPSRGNWTDTCHIQKEGWARNSLLEVFTDKADDTIQSESAVRKGESARFLVGDRRIPEHRKTTDRGWGEDRCRCSEWVLQQEAQSCVLCEWGSGDNRWQRETPRPEWSKMGSRQNLRGKQPESCMGLLCSVESPGEAGHQEFLSVSGGLLQPERRPVAKFIHGWVLSGVNS